MGLGPSPQDGDLLAQGGKYGHRDAGGDRVRGDDGGPAEVFTAWMRAVLVSMSRQAGVAQHTTGRGHPTSPQTTRGELPGHLEGHARHRPPCAGAAVSVTSTVL